MGDLTTLFETDIRVQLQVYKNIKGCLTMVPPQLILDNVEKKAWKQNSYLKKSPRQPDTEWLKLHGISKAEEGYMCQTTFIKVTFVKNENGDYFLEEVV